MLQLRWGKMINVVIWFLVLSFFLVKFAMASIMLDPYLGYSFKGNVEKKTAAESPTYTWKYDGLGYGARVGFSFVGIYLGLEIGSVKQTWEGTGFIAAGVNDNAQKIDGNLLGIYVGAIMPMGMMFRGSYFVMASMRKRDDNGPYNSGDAYQGMGYSLAVGYKIFPYLGVNLEYRSFFLDRIYLASEGQSYNLSDGRELSANEIFFNICAPLIF